MPKDESRLVSGLIVAVAILPAFAFLSRSVHCDASEDVVCKKVIYIKDIASLY
jgi:hypothetical protein